MLLGHETGSSESGDYVKVRVRRKEDSHFINIDLELQTSGDLKPLINELEKDDRAWSGNLHMFEENEPYTSVTFVIGWFLKEKDIFQSYDDKENLVGGVDVLLTAFCDLIENLSKESRKIWDNCQRKEFDIGFQSGNTPKTFITSIQSETVKRCAEIGASLMMTIYPYHNYEFVEKKYLKKNNIKK